MAAKRTVALLLTLSLSQLVLVLVAGIVSQPKAAHYATHASGAPSAPPSPQSALTAVERNDYPPRFLKEHYAASIVETSPAGSFVDQVQAVDPDEMAAGTGGVGPSAEIMDEDGTLVLVPAPTAADPYAHLMIAVPPSQTHKPSKIRYRIEKGAFDDFIIDPVSGVVSVSLTAKLDFERRPIYEIKVVASDSGTPPRRSTTQLTVTLINQNDKNPYFVPTTQRAEVNENAPVNSVVHRLAAADSDAAGTDSLRFAIETMSAIDRNGLPVKFNPGAKNSFMDFFSVDPKTGEVLVASRLNRDIAATLTLNVSVKDVSASPPQFGTGQLIVTIIDYNDSPPAFAQPWSPSRPELSFTFQEEQPSGTLLTTLHASDVDSKISRYSIEPENPYFTINGTTGEIRTRKVLDFESFPTTSQPGPTVAALGGTGVGGPSMLPVQESSSESVVLKFHAYAYDSGIPKLSAMAVIRVHLININDNTPQFEQSVYYATINENAGWGTSVAAIRASDADRGQFGHVTYELINNGHEDKFEINPETGLVTVSNGADLDREMGVSQVVVQVAAVDGAALDQRRRTTVPLYVTIRDVNDNPPRFGRREYEATALGHPDRSRAPIITLAATDPDQEYNGRVAYRITGGNTGDVFEIDRDTGVIYSTASPLERNPTLTEYNLKIEGRDQAGNGPYSDEVLVKIRVMDINRHKPQFVDLPSDLTIEVKENEPVATRVLQIKARDDDPGENGLIRYSFKVGNDQNVQETKDFSIDQSTGIIRTKRPLDRELQSQYNLILSAQDTGTPQSFETLQKLTIVVADVDDTHPYFLPTQKKYSFRLRENEPRGFQIGRVQARDDDIVGPGIIYYHIVDGNDAGLFHMEPTKGILLSNASIDREEQARYELVIKASSSSTPPQNLRLVNVHPLGNLPAWERGFNLEDPTLAWITIQIDDVNDNEPAFEKSVYRAGVDIGADIGTKILTARALDPDEGLNSSLLYQLAGVDLLRRGIDTPDRQVQPIPSPFSVDEEGRIKTTHLLSQYPLGSRFVLHLEAREVSAPHRVAQCKVYLWIYEQSNLIVISLSMDPESVHARQDEIERLFSTAASGQAVLVGIKYHVEHGLVGIGSGSLGSSLAGSGGRVRRDMTDVSLLIVDGYHALNPMRVIERLEASRELTSKESYIPVQRIIPASAALNPLSDVMDELAPMDLVFIIMILLLSIGSVTSLVSCLCLKSWYKMKFIKQALKEAARMSRAASIAAENELNSIRSPTPAGAESTATGGGRSARNKPANQRQIVPPNGDSISGNDNPLWADSRKMYEEQEISMRMTNNGNNFNAAALATDGSDGSARDLLPPDCSPPPPPPLPPLSLGSQAILPELMEASMNVRNRSRDQNAYNAHEYLGGDDANLVGCHLGGGRNIMDQEEILPGEPQLIAKLM